MALGATPAGAEPLKSAAYLSALSEAYGVLFKAIKAPMEATTQFEAAQNSAGVQASELAGEYGKLNEITSSLARNTKILSQVQATELFGALRGNIQNLRFSNEQLKIHAELVARTFPTNYKEATSAIQDFSAQHKSLASTMISGKFSLEAYGVALREGNAYVAAYQKGLAGVQNNAASATSYIARLSAAVKDFMTSNSGSAFSLGILASLGGYAYSQRGQGSSGGGGGGAGGSMTRGTPGGMVFTPGGNGVGTGPGGAQGGWNSVNNSLGSVNNVLGLITVGTALIGAAKDLSDKWSEAGCGFGDTGTTGLGQESADAKDEYRNRKARQAAAISKKSGGSSTAQFDAYTKARQGTMSATERADEVESQYQNFTAGFEKQDKRLANDEKRLALLQKMQAPLGDQLAIMRSQVAVLKEQETKYKDQYEKQLRLHDGDENDLNVIRAKNDYLEAQGKIVDKVNIVRRGLLEGMIGGMMNAGGGSATMGAGMTTRQLYGSGDVTGSMHGAGGMTNPVTGAPVAANTQSYSQIASGLGWGSGQTPLGTHAAGSMGLGGATLSGSLGAHLGHGPGGTAIAGGGTVQTAVQKTETHQKNTEKYLKMIADGQERMLNMVAGGNM